MEHRIYASARRRFFPLILFVVIVVVVFVEGEREGEKERPARKRVYLSRGSHCASISARVITGGGGDLSTRARPAPRTRNKCEPARRFFFFFFFALVQCYASFPRALRAFFPPPPPPRVLLFVRWCIYESAQKLAQRAMRRVVLLSPRPITSPYFASFFPRSL